MKDKEKDTSTPLHKPEWLRVKLLTNGKYATTKQVVNTFRLHTICESGLCPNRAECWRNGTATFMIGGDICTRNCRFCNTKTGQPHPIDLTEPERIAKSIREMNLRYTVITSVDRDDLEDYGASHWAATIRTIRNECPNTGIEVLIPDFQGRTDLIDIVLKEQPDVVGHNMETVERLTPSVRSVANYKQSLEVLSYIAKCRIVCKTGFMVGLGETEKEVHQLIDDVHRTGCTILTIGQYLQPTRHHIPVKEYVSPEQFDSYKKYAKYKGFKYVESAPLVRSSYHAEEVLKTMCSSKK